MTVAVLAKSGAEAIKLESEWVQVVRDPSNTIANALLVYPPCRDMVVAVESLLKGADACIKRFRASVTAVQQSEEFARMLGLSWAVVSITPVHTALVHHASAHSLHPPWLYLPADVT